MTAECESTASPPPRRPEARCRPSFILAINILAEGSHRSHKRSASEPSPDFSQKKSFPRKAAPCPL